MGTFAAREQARAHVTKRVARMSAPEVATALGVRRERVTAWIRAGWLAARKRKVHGMPYYVIDDDAVVDFLYTHGAVMQYLNPISSWRHFWLEGKRRIQATMLEKQHLATLLCIEVGSLRHLIIEQGFPRPDLSHPGKDSAVWYDKRKVAKWLVCHPRYRTTALIEALRIPTEYEEE